MGTITYPLTFDSTETGERFELLQSARTAADRRFRFRWTLAPGKTGPGPHTHPTETETFRVVTGTLRVWVDGRAHELTSGMTLAVPPATPHAFLNPGPTPMIADVDIDGTLMEDMLVGAAVATRDQGARRATMGMLVTLAQTRASVPASVVKRTMLRVIARALRLGGIRANPVPAAWTSVSGGRSAGPTPS